jgi:HPt (histidine-containing phosphotransfer) domain-containing protein
MNDYLAKPVELANLRIKLETWLPPGDGASAAAPSRAAPADDGHHALDASALDASALESVFGHGSPKVRETLDRFTQTVAEDLEDLRTAISRADARRTQMLAHRIKGAARIVGAEPLARASASVEDAALAEDWNAVERQMPVVARARQEVLRFLESI